MVQLGEGMKTVRRSKDELVDRGDLEKEVASQLSPEIKRLEQLLRQLTKSPAPPQVHVAAPNVEVTNKVPEVKPAQVAVDLVGIEELCDEIVGLRKDLGAFVKEMSRPTVRTVERDSDGLITKITDRRT
jgi:hypothetical protein